MSAEVRTVAAWLDAFAEAVRRRDYSAARSYFDADVLGFGTAMSRAEGLHCLETTQWRQIWEVTTGFAFHNVRVYGQATLAVVMAEWTSKHVRDESLRHGRATVALRKQDDIWIAVHTHFSLTPVGAGE